MRVLVTGAAGYLGSRLVRTLAGEREGRERIDALIAMDVRPTPLCDRLPGVTYETLDICSPALGERVAHHRADVVVHLASMVTPPKGCTREQQYQVDVKGTERLLAACIESGVRRLIVTSSGAAYGYHPDNAALLDEDAPLRGHPDFAYADHKRQVEERLARARASHPSLGQLVLRLSTVLGERTKNQITDMFEKPVIIGLAEAASPFTFVWDEDVVRCLAAAVHGTAEGVYNLTGDGVMTLAEIAAALGKRYLALPERLVGRALEVLHRRGLTQYGPEQVAFLRYRPVLSNQRIVSELGFQPEKTTREVFELYRAGAAKRNAEAPARRRVVITGAAGGIGRAMAMRFARDGARVALLDRDQAALERTVAELVAAGHDALAQPCDVRDAAACEAALGEVVATWGGVDVLVNNAGISHRSLLADTTPEVLRRVMDVNFFGAVHVTRAALASLRANKGVIVAISSVAGFAPLIGRTGYTASKHALHGFFDSLRAELQPDGVSVLLVCPSYVDTAIDRNALAGNGERAGSAKATVGKLATPEAVADAVFEAVARRRRLLVPTPVGKASYLLSRFLPRLYERAMRRSVRGEFPA